ncbi:MAG: phosphoglucomutase (alpha-D-glucose-1,6-bisphosphate-dependent) [Candidatus Dormibacteraceae bacterium]
MARSPLAGKAAPASLLVDVPALLSAYASEHPDPRDPGQRVSFGTSGHRGSSLSRTFNEDHVLAIAEAVARDRERRGIDGPLFLGRDTHALSGPALQSVVEVLAAHQVEVRYDAARGFTPTPVVSHAILTHNRGRTQGRADGILITPSHNPPADGGIKYNPPNGGPADTDVTGVVQEEANQILAGGLRGVRRISGEAAWRATSVRPHDYLSEYVDDLAAVVDLDAIRASGLTLGVDPLGGSSLPVWQRIEETHRLGITIVDQRVDPTFSFVPVDHDGKIRMDCSSPDVMAGLLRLRDRYDVAFANDPDADRHGIVTARAGLLDPNHYLAVMIDYLFGGGRDWPAGIGVGKTLVSSSLIDRVVAARGRRLVEVPVGFKWFVEGLAGCTLGFGGEESAGASFLRRTPAPWSTDKDGLIPCLLAAEMTARGGRDPGVRFERIAGEFGLPAYRRVDAPADAAQKAALGRLTPSDVRATRLAGEDIRQVLTEAPGNAAPIGGVKVTSDSAWFAARPSGTEDVYKIYAESFRGPEHLSRVLGEAQSVVDGALAGIS